MDSFSLIVQKVIDPNYQFIKIINIKKGGAMKKRKYISYNQCHKLIDGIEYKMCKSCKTWIKMNEENFKIHPSQKDGYSRYCRKCQEEYNHNNYMKNRDKQIKDARRRQLKNHEEYKEYIKDYRKKRYKDKNDSLRQREKDNAERRRIEGKHKEWLKSESGKDKSKKYNKKRLNKKHIISNKEWIACKEYFKDKDGDYCCAYCGLKIQHHTRIYAGKLQKIDLHKEHVDDNGSQYLNNCVPSCQTCNTNKFQSTLDEWYNEDNPHFTHERYNKIIIWITEDHKEYFEGIRSKNKYIRKI